jgi:hypothetical protein
VVSSFLAFIPKSISAFFFNTMHATFPAHLILRDMLLLCFEACDKTMLQNPAKGKQPDITTMQVGMHKINIK